MTQEELNSMMEGDINIDGEGRLDEFEEYDEAVKDFRVSAASKWPPPPPTEEHKVVRQLDDVTKETEEKSNQIFDVLENVSDKSAEVEKVTQNLLEEVSSIQKTFEILEENFPNIETFKSQNARSKNLSEALKSIGEAANVLGDQALTAMDVMQYQDIHRQKIERVINVMRSLSKYMNSLFEGKIDDERRVSSATHIQGDSTEDVVDDDDIEALIAAFGNKQ
ncbi:MAG: chemotaxis protein [Helicobacteraceae bacterium]